MKQDNTDTREKAMLWFKNMDAGVAQRYYLKYEYLIQNNRLVTTEIIEQIYLLEHTSEPIKDKGIRVIEANDEALNSLVEVLRKYDLRRYTCLNDSGYSLVEREMVKAIDKHHTPLVELCKQLLEIATSMEQRMTRARDILYQPHHEANWEMLNTYMERPVIEKAKNLLP